MDHILKHLNFLELLAKPVSEDQAKALISTSTDKQLNIISEMSLNVLQGNIVLSKHYKKLLLKDADFIRELGDRGIGSKKRRSLAISHIKTISVLLAACLKHITDGSRACTSTT